MYARKIESTSVEEYLALERSSETKHEYLAGLIYAMAGSSARHNRITGNMFASLYAQLSQRNCSIYSSDMRIRIPQTELYTYPDLTIVCGHEHFEDDHEDTLTNPIVLIEVLSPSTESYDRGKKFQHYRTLLSLREYILVAQNEVHVERFLRQPDNKWIYSEANQLGEELELSSIQCSLYLTDVYTKVVFPSQENELEP